MAWLSENGWPLRTRHALDFGSGPGRLSQALANQFDQVTGVDISHTMVETAKSFNRHGDRVRYLVNTRPNLSLFDNGTFDLVYSSITLQHIPPDAGENYIREFVRVLRPGGLAVFQMRNGPRHRPGSLRSRLYTLRRVHLRRVWQRLRGRLEYEMHYIARSRVEELVAGSGGRMLGVMDMNPRRPGRSLRYATVRD
jgi:ubiquinone/menaquinone biosynthesis C-methylase UbiE